MTTETKNHQPSHIVYHVQEREGDRSNIWTRVGAMWPHEDGKGFSMTLNMLPMDGRLTIRDASTVRAAQ